jgi:hypothetical protein
MMLRWISLVPPAIVYCRAPSTRCVQRGASGTSSVVVSSVAYGPSSAPEKSAMRVASSEPNSFSAG